MALFIAQDGAIAAEGAYGKCFKDHDAILGDQDRLHVRPTGYCLQCRMRIFAIMGAFLGWFALILQLYLMLINRPSGGTMLREVVTFFGFFTILTNLLVALVFSSIALQRRGFFSSTSVQAATAGYIAIVAIVYQLLLRALWNPVGAQWWADLLLHTVMPAGYVLFWLLLAPKAGLQWKDAVRWLIYPARLSGVHAGSRSFRRSLPLPLRRCDGAWVWPRSAQCSRVCCGVSRSGIVGSRCGEMAGEVSSGVFAGWVKRDFAVEWGTQRVAG